MEPGAIYFNTEFDTLVNTLRKEHHVPGISIAVVEDRRVYTRGYGFARLPDVLAGADTLYFAGSTTKAMLAAAVGCLLENRTEVKGIEEKLQILRKHRWSTRVKDILPDDFVLEDDIATSCITIEDALSHRTGLAGADNMYGAWMGIRPKSIVKALRFLGPLSKPIRTVFQYNNLMYSVVADVLETVTGLDWGSILRSLIWQPLGMTETFWSIDEIPDQKKCNLAQGYLWTETPMNSKPGGTVNTPSDHFVPDLYLNFAGVAPAGSVISTVRDYAKWINGLLYAATAAGNLDGTTGPVSKENGLAYERQVLSRATFVELTTPRIFHTESPVKGQNSQIYPRSYSLGWVNFITAEGIKHPVLAHGGGLTGFGSQLFLLPNDNFGCVVFGNTAHSSNRIGEILCHELMARKLRLDDEKKCQFARALTVLSPSKADEVKTEDKSEHEDNEPAPKTNKSLDSKYSPDADWTGMVDQITGSYHNPAYGTYIVAEFEDSNLQERITYGPQVTRKDRIERDSKRARARSLSVIPVGPRSWNNRLILCSRPGETGSYSSESQTRVSGAVKETIFFDLELFSMHGHPISSATNTKKEAWPGAGLMPSLSVWQSERWCPYGGALTGIGYSTIRVYDSESSEIPNPQIGLRLSNKHLWTDGSSDNGWANEMVWFAKEA